MQNLRGTKEVHMKVRFWGVRGSVAVSGGDFAATGGNTTCVEVEHEGERLILDGGTGLQALGRSLGSPTRATVLFTHVHWDHIQGVPFFAPAYHPDSELTFAGAPGLREALAEQMRPPQFPVSLDALSARLDFLELRPEVALEIGPFRVLPAAMVHPQGVLVYRIEAGGRSMVFATDVEHGDRLDRRLLTLAEGADLLVHDAQYTAAEYEGRSGPSRRGWGHSTWEQAVELGAKAGASRLALFHHDPVRTDRQVAGIEAVAGQRRIGTFAAREGGVVAL
jgi:phosphoribosyl 1,2-cyclic phosphodiesterase